MFRGLFQKLGKSFRKRGLFGTLRHGAEKLWDRVLEFTPERRRARRQKEREDAAFDGAHGVDTGGIVTLDRLEVPSDNRELGVVYWASGPDDFRRALSAVDVHHEDYVFVDFGSGKGRALLLASEWPFQKIIGIEFSPDLHRIAEQNVRNFQSDRQRCRNIEPVCADATSYALPSVPLVCYFFNPFQAPIMERVIASIQRSHAEHPRPIVVLYYNPQLDALWAAAPFIRKVHAGENFCIYQTPEVVPSAPLPATTPQ
jgi:SAM-dependent methyltransferase